MFQFIIDFILIFLFRKKKLILFNTSYLTESKTSSPTSEVKDKNCTSYLMSYDFLTFSKRA